MSSSTVPKPFIIKATPPYAPSSSSSSSSLSSASSVLSSSSPSSYLQASPSRSIPRSLSPHKRKSLTRPYPSPSSLSLAYRANIIQQYVADIPSTGAEDELTITSTGNIHKNDANDMLPHRNSGPFEPSSSSSPSSSSPSSERSIRTVTAKLTSALEQLNTNRNILATVTEENNALKARIGTLQQEHRLVTGKYSVLQKEHEKCVHEQIESDNNKAHIQALEDAVKQLSNVAAEAVERIQKIEYKHHHALEQNKILEERIKILEHRALTAEKEAKEATALNLKADQRIATAERQVTAMEKRTVEAEKQMSIMERRMMDAEKRYITAERTITEGEIKRKLLEENREILEKQITNLQEKYRLSEQKTVEYENQLRKAQIRIDKAQHVAAEAQQGAAQAVSLLTEREQQLSALRETLVFATSIKEDTDKKGTMNTNDESGTNNNHNNDPSSLSFEAILAAESSLDTAALTYEHEMHILRERLLQLEKRAAEASGHTIDLSKEPPSAHALRKSGNSTGEAIENDGNRENDDDNYDSIIPLKGPQSVEAMITMLRGNGLNESQLVIFIDCTKSNLTNGAKSFDGRSLHDITNPVSPNPYQVVITCVGKTLAPFDADNRIPCYGFGDRHSADVSVFPFHTDPKLFCNGFEDVLAKYTEKISSVTLAGPTSFAPAIRKTMELVKSSKVREFTVCLIIADGQVNNVKETETAIVEASRLPIAICVVGVGDGPWEQMYEFDHRLPARRFDNFRFVSFNSIMDAAKVRNLTFDNAFALSVLAEIPQQYAQAKALRLL